MVNYSNGKIYKIFSHNSPKIYIGSTAKPYLSTRLAQHVFQHKYFLNGASRIYMTSYLVMDYGDFHIELVESFPCKSRDELSAREGYWQREFKDLIVNRQINKLPKVFKERKPFTRKVPYVPRYKYPPAEETTKLPKKERKPYTRQVPYEDTEHYRLYYNLRNKTEINPEPSELRSGIENIENTNE